MKFLILLLFSLSLGAERSVQDLINLVGRKGETTHFYDLYLNSLLWTRTAYGLQFTGWPATSADPLGLYFAPTLYGPSHGADAFRMQAHFSGYHPYGNLFEIFPPVLDSSGSIDHLTAIDIQDMYGADSSNYAIRTRRGRVLIGDTLSATRLLQEGGGHQWHVSLIRENRKISSDTDHILIGYPTGAPLKDTLPYLYESIGQDFLFMQYQAAKDSAWVIYPSGTDKIEGYDSLVLKSNFGKSWVHLLGQGDRWRVLGQHEEGAFAATLNGVSPSVTDTAFYSVDNLLDVRVRIKPLIGVSTAAGTTFSITGLNANFTNSALDTSYTATASVIGYDNSNKTGIYCLMKMNGIEITCYKNDFSAFTIGNGKGAPYGMEFSGRLARPAGHQ